MKHLTQQEKYCYKIYCSNKIMSKYYFYKKIPKTFKSLNVLYLLKKIIYPQIPTPALLPLKSTVPPPVIFISITHSVIIPIYS